MYANYKAIPFLIHKRTNFKGNSVKGIWESDNDYIVYSYKIPILKFHCNNLTYFNNIYYSITTSRIQNISRELFTLSKSRGIYNFPIAKTDLFDLYEYQQENKK